MLVAAFSGGKDSTAMVLRLAELGEAGVLLFNVVGNEFPDLLAHVRRVAGLAGWPLELTTPGFGLYERIRHYEALPNQWQRWCTRELKIEPTVAWLKAHPGSTLCVGLRADEPPDERGGIYGPYAEYRYPLREWGWGLKEVRGYLEARGVCVPRRTNCPVCYAQRLSEWWLLWKEHPELFAEGEALEALTGHTFRSPGRDTWPAELRELRERFEAGKAPRGIRPLPLFGDYDVTDTPGVCRVCSL
jgi:PP-loop superfamily ATP-utilizing enzyme